MGKRSYIFVSAGQDLEMHLVAADSLARMRRLSGGEPTFHWSELNGEFVRIFGLSPVPVAQQSDWGERYFVRLVEEMSEAGTLHQRRCQAWRCEDCSSYYNQPGHCSSCNKPLSKCTRAGFIIDDEKIIKTYLNQLNAGQISVLPKIRQADFISVLNNQESGPICLGWLEGERKLAADWVTSLLEEMLQAGLVAEGKPESWSNSVMYLDKEGLFSRLREMLIFMTAAQLPWPETVVCHNPLQFLDNHRREVSPMLLAKNYGGEGIRYIMLSSRVYGGDPPLAEEQLIHRLNQHLSNELGNLVSRTISMVSRYSDDLVPQPDVLTRQTQDLDLRSFALEAPGRVEELIEQQELHQAMAVIWRLVSRVNKFIEETSPWQLAGNTAQAPRLNTILYTITEALRFVGILLLPLLPETGESILYQLGLAKVQDLRTWTSLRQWGLLPPRTRISPAGPLFPRIIPGRAGEEPDGAELILREELDRIRMVAARVVSAEAIPEAEGLLQLILYDGRQRRKVLSPLAQHYKAQDLSGKKLVLVANLRPVEVQGLMSEGEVLTIAGEGGKLHLIVLEEDVPEGSRILC